MISAKTFDDTVVEVFHKFFNFIFGANYDMKHIKIDKRKFSNFDMIIVIALFGDIEGMVLLELHKETAKKFLEKISAISKHKVSFEEFVKGSIGELANILTSSIISELTKTNKKKFGNTQMSTPSLFSGKDMSVDLYYKYVFNVNISSEFGIFKITLGIKE